MAGSLRGGEVLALTGNLGSGKTTFVQGLAQGLGVKRRVISPSFILMRKYSLPITKHQSPITNFYHLDLYRLEENFKKEIENLGIKETWQISGNVVAVEWAEKIKEFIPKGSIWIKFEDLGGNARQITIKKK